MAERVYFAAENVIVSSAAVSVGRHIYLLRDLAGARSERIRFRWWRVATIAAAWQPYTVFLRTRGGREFRVLRHRNAYFTFQMTHAIQAALENREPESPSSPHRRLPTAA